MILYDENGGFFDHVPPPSCFETPASEDTPLGFRVPAIVVSPYSKRKHACHTVFDHTSIMKSISERWGVAFDESFGPRWKEAPGIWDNCFDFGAPMIGRRTYTGEPLSALDCGSGVRDALDRESNPLERVMERVFVLPSLKALDRRARVFDTLNTLEHGVISLKRMRLSRT